MKSRDFCYWLQGYFELAADGNRNDHSQAVQPGVSGLQAQTIQKHLAMVFKHEIDPSHGDQNMQSALDHIHSQLPDGVLARC